MCCRISDKPQNIIKVGGEISGVKSKEQTDIFDKLAVGGK